MIKAIFFDSGNVLVKEGTIFGIKRYAETNSIDDGDLYRAMHDFSYWKDFSLGNISEEEYFKEVEKNFKGELKLKQLRQLILDNFVQNVELLDYIKTLKDKYKIGVISNNPKEWFEYFSDTFGWGNIFDVVALSSYLHIRKPDKEIFEYALNQAGVSGKEAIYVDDRSDRIEGAEALGMKIIIFKNVADLANELNNILKN